MAIRIAVGASRREVLSRVFRKAIVLAAMGIALGIVGSTIAVRALAGLLYGVRAENIAMFVLASIVLTLTTLAASWNPAWRAANIDPMQTLRSE
jgi:putative ABC transport system permease protein